MKKFNNVLISNKFCMLIISSVRVPVELLIFEQTFLSNYYKVLNSSKKKLTSRKNRFSCNWSLEIEVEIAQSAFKKLL